MSKFLTLIKAMKFGTAADAAVQVGVSTDTEPRLQIDAGGKLNWGAGSTTAPDTNLYRSTTNTLKTDDAFIAAGGLTIKSYEVDTTGASAGTVLAFNGTKFAPAVASGGSSVEVSDTTPSSPSTGDLWYESDTGKTFIYYDNSWVQLVGGGTAITLVSDTTPVSPVEGQLWYESDTGATFVYVGSSWVEIGTSQGPYVCTSSTRPSAPYEGQTIYETDTDLIRVWNGSSWVQQLLASTFDSKGDLLVATANDTVSKLGVGTNNQVLVADSAQATGVKWGYPTGSVIQVVQGVYGSGQYSTGSTSFVDSNLSATITPKSSSSKILCMVSQYGYSGSSATKMEIQLLRGSTVIANSGLYGGDANNLDFSLSVNYLDSPSTTSATTYKTQYRSTSGNLVYLGRNSGEETLILMEIAG